MKLTAFAWTAGFLQIRFVARALLPHPNVEKAPTTWKAERHTIAKIEILKNYLAGVNPHIRVDETGEKRRRFFRSGLHPSISA